ncbi:MAG: hypothetical protein J6W96_04770 [Alphaproteobacteria bacterium]|nr:hypothetical protein [Alphaproteobacteria bacterium]
MLEPEKRKVRRAGMYVNEPAPKREIKVQNDTVPYYNGSAAYYTYGYNSITNKIKIGEGYNELNFQSNMVHEQKHSDNANEGIKGYWMSLEQYYKICRYDEISANIASLLYLREKYIQAKTDEEREQIAKARGGEFSFYFDAIKRGEIDPFTDNPEKFMEEMKFIAQGTQKMWMKNSLDWYNEGSLTKHVQWYYNRIDDIDVTNEHFNPNKENYLKAEQSLFRENLAGIDFTPFIEEIDEVPWAVIQADRMIQEGKSADEVRAVLSMGFEDNRYCMSSTQYAVIRSIYYINHGLSDISNFREEWLNASEEERAQMKKNSIRSDSMCGKYKEAVFSGEIQINSAEIGKAEEEFIGSLFQDEEKIGCSGPVIRGWMEFRAKYGEIPQEVGNEYFDYYLRKGLTMNGIDFSPYLKEVEIDAVYARMDELYDNGNNLAGKTDEAFEMWKNDEGKGNQKFVLEEERVNAEQTKEEDYSQPFLSQFIPPYRKPGDPKWKKWSEEKRVSEPYEVEVIDLSMPFLKNRYNLLVSAQEAEIILEGRDKDVQVPDNLQVYNYHYTPEERYYTPEERAAIHYNFKFSNGEAHHRIIKLRLADIPGQVLTPSEGNAPASGSRMGTANVKFDTGTVAEKAKEKGLPKEMPGSQNKQNFIRNKNTHGNW